MYKLSNIPELVKKFGSNVFLIEQYSPEAANTIWTFWGSVEFYQFTKKMAISEEYAGMPEYVLAELYDVQCIHDELFPEVLDNYIGILEKSIAFSNKPDK